MKLITDNNHKKIDLRNLSLSKVKRFNARLGSVALSIALLSGSGIGKKVVEAATDKTSSIKIEREYLKDSVFVEHDKGEKISTGYTFYPVFDDSRTVQGDQYTYEDLEHVEEALIYIHDNVDYDFLNYMPNLKKLSIVDQSTMPKLQNIDGSRFPVGITIELQQLFGNSSFCEERYRFLKEIPQIGTLALGSSNSSYVIDSSFLHEFQNIENLKLSLDATSNFQYSDFHNFSSVELVGKPYDIAMYFSNEDLEKLEHGDIPFVCPNIDKVKSINNQITSIVHGLNIPSDATDQEKLNAVLEYVLSTCQYDEDVAKDQNNNGGKNRERLLSSFYQEGQMTAAFEKSTQVCGNYAALTATLCREVGLDAYFMNSFNHAWDAVKVGDYFYYVDPTWLDGHTIAFQGESYTGSDGSITIQYIPMTAEEILKSDDPSRIERCSWYMEDPTNISGIDNQQESHKATIIPPGVELVPIESHDELDTMFYETDSQSDTARQGDLNVDDEKENDISSHKFKVNFSGKTYIVGGAALVGILSALGIGSLLHHKKKNKRQGKYKEVNPFDKEDNISKHF